MHKCFRNVADLCTQLPESERKSQPQFWALNHQRQLWCRKLTRNSNVAGIVFMYLFQNCFRIWVTH